ncbi:MAG: glycosyl transferase, family 2, partial [uncultured Solirubrobacteraceae bacterium]
EHHRTPSHLPPRRRGRRAPRAPRLGRHPVPERGGEHRAVRAHRARRPRSRGHPGRGGRGRQRLHGRLGRAGRRGGRARRARAAARLRVRLPGRLRRRPRQVHRHGRRGPDVR